MTILSQNFYPGRGIVVGTSSDGQHAVQIYWIMGRSENSRNRVFTMDGGRLFTEPANPAKVKDPSLIIYNAMDEIDENYVVSNGDQTDTVMGHLRLNRFASLSHALVTREFEPDAPNFTPRITGLCIRLVGGECLTELSLLRRSEASAKGCERSYYQYDGIKPGFGFCITTYDGEGEPLPSFSGGPFPVPIIGDIKRVLRDFWAILNRANRISLAVKFINLYGARKSEIELINQYP